MNIKPQLEDLRLFCIVARHRSFAETARELGISKAVVSKRMALLEAAVQEKLFHRTTRNVSLTAQGEIVHQWAQRIREDIDLMGEAISREKAAPSGLLRICSSTGFGRSRLAPALSELARRFPRLEIQVELLDRPVDLIDEGFDVAFRVGELSDSSLIARALAPYRLRLCAAPAYIAAHLPITHPSELTQHECLGFSYTELRTRWTFEGPDGLIIVLVSGIDQVNIGVTLCDPDNIEPMTPIAVDEPTLTMNFMVNSSPLAGREGKFVTSRQIRERLEKELLKNVALRVNFTSDSDTFEVSGRGELHLTILLENMRREGYELAVGRPRVVFKEIDGVKCEPYEMLTVDVEEEHQGGVMEELGRRRGELQDMQPDGKGRVRLEYRIPARGLIGFQGEFLTMTRGTGLASHVFDDYGPMAGQMAERRNGVLISQNDGEAVAYALWNLQDRGRMFVSPGDALYEGMIIGIHTRDNDLVVNPIKGKQLTNVRASGTDEAVRLINPIQLTLESAIEFIADDEIVEITPKNIRLRKRFLKEHDRKRAAREEA